MLGLRSLLVLTLSLVALRTLVHFAIFGLIDDLANLALLDLTALLIGIIARGVVPMIGEYFASVVVAFVATLLPLAGLGWVLETLASSHVSLLGLFMGLIGIGTGGIAGSPTKSIPFVLALLVLAGGCYGLSQSHSVLLDVILLPAPYVLTAIIALAWRARKTLPFGRRSHPTESPKEF